jgi:hypothetical protein
VKTSVRFRGDLEVVNDIEQLLEESSAAEVVEFQAEEDSGIGVEFDVGLIASLVGLISNLFFDGPIIHSLVHIFRKKPGSRISIETPRRTIIVTSSADFSENELREIIECLELLCRCMCIVEA